MVGMGKYYGRKLIRYLPLNLMCLLFFVYGLPLLGFGPIWPNFATVVAPCKKMWWTNALWISNLYPEAYDDKCLPWTWFMPAYIQLSLLVPLIVGVYLVFENKTFAGFFLTLLGFAALAANFAFVTGAGKGGSMVNNEAFFNDVFMNPLFHFSSFYIGIITCLVYKRFMEDRAQTEAH